VKPVAFSRPPKYSFAEKRNPTSVSFANVYFVTKIYCLSRTFGARFAPCGHKILDLDNAEERSCVYFFLCMLADLVQAF
jgi:hypothetical protein